jgi:hypothetical protein
MRQGRRPRRPVGEIKAAEMHCRFSICGLLSSHDVIILVQNLLMKYHIDLGEI